MSIVLIPAALLAACGGDAPTPTPDEEARIGAWREMPNAAETRPEEEGGRTKLVFRDDGTMTLGAFAEARPGEGTYAVDGDELTIATPFGAASITFGITADDRLALSVMTPVGAVDGVVGTWTTVVKDDGVPRTVTAVFRADGTTSLTNYGGGEPGTQEFMWHGVGDDVEIVASGNFPIAHLTLMEGVLAEPYERLP